MAISGVVTHVPSLLVTVGSGGKEQFRVAVRHRYAHFHQIPGTRLRLGDQNNVRWLLEIFDYEPHDRWARGPDCRLRVLHGVRPSEGPPTVPQTGSDEKFWGEGAGVAIHFVAYTVVPIVVGIAMIIAGVNGLSIVDVMKA